jgi:hypothetical protein
MSDEESDLHLTGSHTPGELLEAAGTAIEDIVHPPTPVAPVAQWGSTAAPTDLQGLLYVAEQAVREAGLGAESGPAGDPQTPWMVATSQAVVVVVACAPIDRDHSRALVFAASSDSATAETARNQVRSAIDRLAAASPAIDHPEEGLQASDQ